MPLPSRMNPLARRPPAPPLTFTAVQGNSTVTLNVVGSLTLAGIQYRTTGEGWTAYTAGTAIALANIGDRVQFRNTNSTLSLSDSNYAKFAMTGRIAASGSVQSLLNRSDDCYANCFCNLFRGCASLTLAPELTATTLATNCYRYMFRECTSLAAAPALPATSLADYCYFGMFIGCTALTLAPVLPATTLATYCYGSMFSGCTSLTDLSDWILPAAVLAEYCYSSMFKGCTALTAAPELTATTLTTYCYGTMFQDCTSLTLAPALSATSLANYCYVGMFNGCTALTAAPALPATTLRVQCYREMFRNCASLSAIEVNFTAWDGTSTTDWVSGVAASGTFKKPSALSGETGTSRIPANWTVINQ